MADILIRGVEMPTQCGNCPMSTNARRCTILWREFGDPSERLEDCPLIPLPAEHGRLIDADELFDTMRFNRDHAELNDVMLGLDEAVGVVMNAPTIIKAEGDF